MQSVIKLVQGRCNKLVIAGGFATPNDFVGYLNKFHTEFGIHIPDMAGFFCFFSTPHIQVVLFPRLRLETSGVTLTPDLVDFNLESPAH